MRTVYNSTANSLTFSNFIETTFLQFAVWKTHWPSETCEPLKCMGCCQGGLTCGGCSYSGQQSQDVKGPWENLSFDILSVIKAQVEQSLPFHGIRPQTIRAMRMVNRHWCTWATGTATSLRILRGGVPARRMVGLISGTFTNVSSLHLPDTTNDFVASLPGLAVLTAVDLHGSPGVTDSSVRELTALTILTKLSLCGCSNITDESVHCLGNLTTLKCLILAGCSNISNVGMDYLKSCTALVKLDSGWMS